MKIQFTLNGRPVSVEAPAQISLLHLLRDYVGLTGTKEGCGVGECGACSILVDGQLRLACLMVAGQLDGHRLTTIEGLGESPLGAKVQQAFAQAGAVQCGYCTPGMIMSAEALLRRNPDPTEDEIRLALSGNICRCSGYVQIVRAVKRAAKERREAQCRA